MVTKSPTKKLSVVLQQSENNGESIQDFPPQKFLDREITSKGKKIPLVSLSSNKIQKITTQNVNQLDFDKIITEFRSNTLAFKEMQMINFEEGNKKVDMIKMVNYLLSLN